MPDVLAAFPGPAAVLIGIAAILLGATVQGSIGFGLGLVAIPILAMFIPEQLPQVVVVATLPLTLTMLLHERVGVRLRKVGWLLVGRFVGVFPAIVVLALVGPRTLQICIALLTLVVAATMMWVRTKWPVTAWTQLAAGTVSGFAGTATGLGGPPIAMLYAHQQGATLRATLAAVMFLGNTITVVGYVVIDRLRPADVVLATLMLIPIAVGLRVGVMLRRVLDGRRLRVTVLAVVMASATSLLGRGILG